MTNNKSERERGERFREGETGMGREGGGERERDFSNKM